MTAGSFDSRAMDLSALAAKQPPAGGAPAPAGASYVVKADDRTFEAVLGRSMQHPIVIEFTSPRANAGQLSAELTRLANAAGGKWLLVQVDIDASPALAQMLQIQAVPLVVGALAGQLVPLFQGTKDAAEISAVIDQLLQAAVANGIVGHAQPVSSADPAADEAAAAAALDEKFAGADAAMQAGDYALAVEEFDKILAANPGDAEAFAGKAGAQMLLRLGDADPNAALAQAQANPDDVDAQLAAADVELASGNPEAAFARLLDVVRSTAGDDREKARVRLLELFETVGATDPAVLKARRDLMTALF